MNRPHAFEFRGTCTSCQQEITQFVRVDPRDNEATPQRLSSCHCTTPHTIVKLEQVHSWWVRPKPPMTWRDWFPFEMVIGAAIGIGSSFLGFYLGAF